MASSCVSSLVPASRSTGSAKMSARAVITTVSTTVIKIACTRTRFAPSRSPSPLRRATMALTATFTERKTARQMNFGCLVRPMAAMAAAPSDDTIMVSTTLTSATRKDSSVEGHATRNARLSRSPSSGRGPSSCVRFKMRRALKSNEATRFNSQSSIHLAASQMRPFSRYIYII